ncbi:MAG: hypothetical protein K6T78_08670 [Alicyclobacillus sp.]|nr:hypothetical protein [Alicyclobacillus sp.]
MKPTTKIRSAFEYWLLIPALCRGDRAVRERMDIPLQQAVTRTRVASGWAWACTLAAIAANVLPSHAMPTAWTRLTLFAQVGLWTCTTLAALAFGGAAAYGFLRLFTLVSHNLTTTLFKVRGQRLRLLNVLASCQTFVVAYAAGAVLEPRSPVVAWVWCVGVSVYLAWVLARSYAVIFHSSFRQAVRLVLGGFLISAFVLAVGAVAVGAALGVIALVVILLIRPAIHTRP